MKPLGGMGASDAGPQPLIEMAVTKTKKTRQISFKVEDSLADRIEAAAEGDDIPVADFVRKVFLWGLDQYEAVGGYLPTLRRMALPEELIEKTLREERQHRRDRRKK